jgi:hypothetical protein
MAKPLAASFETCCQRAGAHRFRVIHDGNVEEERFERRVFRLHIAFLQQLLRNLKRLPFQLTQYFFGYLIL